MTALAPRGGEGKGISVDPEPGSGFPADDTRDEVAFEHHGRRRPPGEGLADRFRIAGPDRRSRPAVDDARIEHPGHEPQRRGHGWIGPRDAVRGQQVITRWPGQLQVEVGEPVGERPPVTAADRERLAAGDRELVFQREQAGHVRRRRHPGSLEDTLVVPDQGLVRGLEPDTVEGAADRAELPPGRIVVVIHGTARDLAERDEHVFVRERAEQPRLREERHVRRIARGQPGLQEGWHAVADRGVADRHPRLAGEGAEHELEMPLLDA